MENITEGYFTLIIVAAIINVLVIIGFFGLVFYVEDIKKILYNQNGYKVNINKAEEELFIGNKEKAKEYYMRAKFHAKTDVQRQSLSQLILTLN